jgi:hypothetical protein
MPSKLLYEHWATHWQVPHAYPSLFPYDAARNEGWTNHTCPLFLPAFESDDLRGFVSESFFATAAEFCSTAVDSALYFQCLLEQVLMHRFVRDTQQLRESIVDLNDIFQQQKRLHNEVPAFAAGSRLYQVYQWCHLNLSLLATDPEGSPIQYAVHAVPADSLFNTSTGGFSWYAGAASQGLHVVNISASDGVQGLRNQRDGSPDTGALPNPYSGSFCGAVAARNESPDFSRAHGGAHIRSVAVLLIIAIYLC